MGYCFQCGRKMKVPIYGICKRCEETLENLWDSYLCALDPEDREGAVWSDYGHG